MRLRGRGGAAGLTVIAHGGAIVFVGDDGRLTANTGAATASGVVAMDSASSAIGSGVSTRVANDGVRSAGGTPSAAGARSDGGTRSDDSVVNTRATAKASDGAGATASAPAGAFVPSLNQAMVPEG